MLSSSPIVAPGPEADRPLCELSCVTPACFRVTPGDPLMVRADVGSDHFIDDLPTGAVVRGHVVGARLFLTTGGVVKLKYLEPCDTPG